jgi:hypothetical protein
MLVVDKRKKGFLKLETVHFLEDYSTYKSDSDIVRFMQCKNCPSNVNKLYTLHIDLLKDMDEIYSGLNKKTKKL